MVPCFFFVDAISFLTSPNRWVTISWQLFSSYKVFMSFNSLYCLIWVLSFTVLLQISITVHIWHWQTATTTKPEWRLRAQLVPLYYTITTGWACWSTSAEKSPGLVRPSPEDTSSFIWRVGAFLPVYGRMTWSLKVLFTHSIVSVSPSIEYLFSSSPEHKYLWSAKALEGTERWKCFLNSFQPIQMTLASFYSSFQMISVATNSWEFERFYHANGFVPHIC